MSNDIQTPNQTEDSFGGAPNKATHDGSMENGIFMYISLDENHKNQPFMWGRYTSPMDPLEPPISPTCLKHQTLGGILGGFGM